MATMFDSINSKHLVFYQYNWSELLRCRFLNHSIFKIDKIYIFLGYTFQLQMDLKILKLLIIS